MKISKKNIIGIDIGGTKIRGVLWNGKRVLKSKEISTPKTLSKFESALINLTKFLGPAKELNVGAAGIINGTKLARSPNIPYIKNFDFKTKLDNDARCFARAHQKLTHLGRRAVLFLTLGTGVGRALIKNGKILDIKKFEYPEHWEREYQKLRDGHDNERLAEFLTKNLKRIIKIYQPALMVVGGGAASGRERKGFLGLLREELKIKIQKSKLGKNATAIGAALL